jgi:pimeloyl-ACP methyl ester carboxylesterase
VVAGFSAGSGSILEFGLRHPDRTVALILANCRLGGGVTTSRTLMPLFRLAYAPTASSGCSSGCCRQPIRG